MVLDNIELAILIEALKSTTAYKESRSLAAEKEGKMPPVSNSSPREKGEIIYDLVKELEMTLKQRYLELSGEAFSLSFLAASEVKIDIPYI